MPHSLDRRTFLKSTTAAAATVGIVGVHSSTSVAAGSVSPNEKIGIGLIGAGGRGSGLARGFAKRPLSKLVAVADPDSSRAGNVAKQHGAEAYTDLRKMLENPAVDAVVVATCNHWHCLASIWAMQAGKDVYVEKPLSHNQWEGRQVVNAAKKYGRIVQLGTQQRSDPMQADIKKFLHQDKALGAIRYAQANRLGPRGAIGKRPEQTIIPNTVDYNLWLGPAAKEEIYRNRLHYDWHWDYNTGSGEMGNWGVHVLDDVRNVVYQDKVRTPKQIFSVGGRLGWDDAGNTPNVHYVYFDTGMFPTFIALSNLPQKPGDKKSWMTKGLRGVEGPSTGYIVACEGGYYMGWRGGGRAVDLNGKEIRKFKGKSHGNSHQDNFLECVKSRKSSDLNAEIQIGHDSTGWCNLANVAHRAGGKFSTGKARKAVNLETWPELLNEMRKQLSGYGIKGATKQLSMSPILTHDPETEMFTGEGAEMANALNKREGHGDFKVPEIS